MVYHNYNYYLILAFSIYIYSVLFLYAASFFVCIISVQIAKLTSLIFCIDNKFLLHAIITCIASGH